jgi:hypothetical protein
MGRPLKIAKAQAVLTITDTAETGSIVTISGGNLTTSPTVGVAKGMPFQVATTVGGLTAGVTYFVNSILSNTTFDVSATDLSVQPQVMATMTDTSSQTVLMSVGVVDAYFNNPVGGAGFPATNANTYGVVGGNTAIVGKQVLTRVAIGINGTGTLYTPVAVNTSTVVVGVGTDLANLTTGAALQVGVANINGSTDYVNLGFASATKGDVSVAVANTTVSGNVIGTSGNAQTLIADMPITFDASFGGLTAGTTYFVKTIANAAAFTVSTSQGGSPQVLTANASVTGNAIMNRVALTANANVVASNAAYVYANDEAGFIVRQKGKTKYLVTGGTTGLTAQCFTANVANTALTPNTMNILSTDVASATAYVSSINDYNSEVFPTQVAAGSISAGTVYTIYFAGTTNWTAIGAMANMTGITFTATASGSGTGTAVEYSVNPDVIATFNTAFAANAANGQPNPIVTIASA